MGLKAFQFDRRTLVERTKLRVGRYLRVSRLDQNSRLQEDETLAFIERHAPNHVQRLPNGGVVLATHPYRTLWPLWADALFLLGIIP
jgi:hypothetical protein